MRLLGPQPSVTTSLSRPAGWRRFSSQPFEIGKADLDQRPDRVLEARFSRNGERLLVACPRFRGIDALLEAIVTGDEELLNPLTRVFGLHDRSLAAHISV
jgi:hypothetical protein